LDHLSINLDSVQDLPVYYEGAKCIEQKDGILLLSNLTTKRFDDNFQQVANNIVVTTYIEKRPIDITRRINVRGYDVASDTTTDRIGFGSVDDDSTNSFDVVDQWFDQSVTDDYNNGTNFYKDSSLKKGFQPNEVYSFSITPIYKDGSIGFAYHIPCNKDNFTEYPAFSNYTTTKKYVSDLDYPSYMNMGPIGTKIRHHRMPSMTIVSGDLNPTTNVYDPAASVNILRVRFFNIIFPQAIKDKIQGYIIGFQQRNKDINTSIIDEGVAIPYNYWPQTGKYYNGVLNGRCSFRGDIGQSSAGIAIGPSHPYAMYYSPSTQIGLEIKEGFKFHIQREAQHYYYNGIAAAANKYFTRPSILKHAGSKDNNYTYDAQFFDGNKHTQGMYAPTTIVKSLTNNGDYPGNTTNIVDGKVYVGGGTNYVHIETQGQIWDSYIGQQNVTIISHYWRDWSNDNNVDRAKRIVSVRQIENQSLSIGRVTNPISNQYGNIYNAEYLVAETVLDPSQTQVEVEGDTYTFKHWFNIRSIHKQTIDNIERQFNFDFVAGVWLNSQNNFSLRHRASNEGLYYPQTKTFFTGGSHDMFGNYWYYRSLGYNKQYSALNNNKLNFPRPLLFSENNVFENRTIYSKQSFESELSDQYRIFPALQFHDIPKDRGTITDTFVFNNNFYHHTEYGLWLSYFNPNTIQSTSQGDVVLGNAGIFKIPSKLILDIKGGYMGTLDKSGVNTPFGRVFIDHSQRKVFLFAGDSPVEISDLGLFSFFRDNINPNKKCSFGYDWKNKRLLLSVTDKNYSASLNSIVNNGQLEVLNNGTHNSLSKAKNLGSLDVPIKIRSWEDLGSSIFFKFNLNDNKTIVLDGRLQGPCTLNIYKKIDDFQIDLIETRTLPISDYTDVLFPIGGGLPPLVQRTWLFNRYTVELTSGENYIEIKQLSGYPLKDINLLGIGTPFNYVISYYPKTQTWTSLHDFIPSSYLTINSSSYAWYNNSFYNLANDNGIKKNSHITFVENTQPDAFKRFDRMEINTMSGRDQEKYSPGFVEPDNYIFNDKSFSTIHCWNDRQNSTELDLFYSHDYNLMSEYYNDRIPANYYRSSFHIELPPDAVIDPYKNIFDVNNTDVNAEFKSHLKGKFLYTKLSYNDDKPLVLNYIKTFFKPSVA